MLLMSHASKLSIMCILLLNTAIIDSTDSITPVSPLDSCSTSTFQKFTITDPGTSCIDGSNPAYYHQPGYDEGAKKWHVHFEGGGWCMDPEECFDRSSTTLGTSIQYEKHNWRDCSLLWATKSIANTSTYQSHSTTSNPYLHNWNAVHVKYCDSSSYAGDATIDYKGHKLMFKGKNNRDAYIRSILDLGMKNATDIILSGCSAGGLAIILGLDDMAQKIREANPTAKIRGLADSSFFLDVTGHRYMTGHNHNGESHRDSKPNKELDFSGLMRRVFTTTNMSAGISNTCLSKYHHEISGFSDILSPASHCVFPEHIISTIETPLFLVQSIYDEWQVHHTYDVKLDHDQDIINSRGARITKEIEKKFLSKPQHGAFLSSCFYHCSCRQDDVWNGNSIASTFNSSRGLTPAAAFWKWYSENSIDHINGKATEPLYSNAQNNKHYYGQVATFPCYDCCDCLILVDI